MISAFANTWKLPELRERIIFTLLMIIIVRLGVHITLPGIDSSSISNMVASTITAKDAGTDGVVGAMIGIFSGGGLENLGIFALGIMPYISASILTQLATAVIPKVSRLAKEDGGRQKINQATRLITILIAVVQGYLLVRACLSPEAITNLPGFRNYVEATHGDLVPVEGFFSFVLPAVISIVAGTLLLMWIGDQITDRGIGNGTSIIITVNIISSMPTALAAMWTTLIGGNNKTGGAVFILFLFLFLVFVVAAVICLTQAQRRIPIQYAKRIQGRKQFGGQTQYLPLKINYANVMPIIFATAVLGIPPFILRQFGVSWAEDLNLLLSQDRIWYYVIAGAMIFFFAYFWVATMFNPSEISENLKRDGGYIPGVRPGTPTKEFLDFTMTRLTFAGAVFLVVIFSLPYFVTMAPEWTMQMPRLDVMVTMFFGGTSLLIMVGVVLDIMRQIETHLLQKNYDGFLRKGKIKGRYDNKGVKVIQRSGGSMVYLLAFAALLFVGGVAAFIIKNL
jgi:preprotein translocase subunit SecY